MGPPDHARLPSTAGLSESTLFTHEKQFQNKKTNEQRSGILIINHSSIDCHTSASCRASVWYAWINYVALILFINRFADMKCRLIADFHHCSNTEITRRAGICFGPRCGTRAIELFYIECGTGAIELFYLENSASQCEWVLEKFEWVDLVGAVLMFSSTADHAEPIKLLRADSLFVLFFIYSLNFLKLEQ